MKYSTRGSGKTNFRNESEKEFVVRMANISTILGRKRKRQPVGETQKRSKIVLKKNKNPFQQTEGTFYLQKFRITYTVNESYVQVEYTPFRSGLDMRKLANYTEYMRSATENVARMVIPLTFSNCNRFSCLLSIVKPCFSVMLSDPKLAKAECNKYLQQIIKTF